MRLTLRALNKRVTLIATAFVLSVGGLTAMLSLTINQEADATSVSSEVVYNALPNVTSPTNYPSVGYEATSTSEFGDYVHLGGTNRTLDTVTVTMSDWAKYADYANDSRYTNNASTWSWPVTLNVYGSTLDANGVPTTKLATVTQMITIPWRPASDATCPDTGYGVGSAWRDSAGTCYNGLAFNATFDLSSKNVTLPNDVIVGVAYNTQDHGSVPTGTTGPYNSLNVAVPDNQPFSVGTDDSAGTVLQNSTWSGAYGSGTTTGIFRTDTGWIPNGTLAMQITATAPLTLAACATTNTVNTTSLSTWNRSDTRTNGHNQLLANSLHVYTDDSSSNAKAAGYYPASFKLADLGEGFGLTATAISGSTPPALQLTVDLDGNGTPEGNLVAEPGFYGTDTLWLSSNWTGLDISSAPTTFDGGGVHKGGTVNAWLAAFPNAKVMAIGYSLGSGVKGDYNVTKLTANCTDYTFGLAAPTDLTPTNGMVTNDPAFVDTWSAVEGAAGYEYRTANALNGSDLGPIIYSDSSTTQAGRYSTVGSTVTRQNGGTPDGNYYWQVRAVDASGNPGPWSVISKVTVDTTAPSAPSGLVWRDSNNQGALNGFTNVQKGTLSWQDADSSVDHYLYKFWTNIPGYFDGQAHAWVTSDSQYITKNSTGGSIWTDFADKQGTYYFCVAAVDAIGNTSACSDTVAITYDTTAPGVPTLQTPTNGALINYNNFWFNWTDVADAVSYEAQFSQSNSVDSNGSLNVGVWAGDASHNQPTESRAWSSGANGTWYWQVRAVDAAGNKSAWTSPWSLTIDMVAPVVSVNPISDTSNTEPTISGTTSELGGSVTIIIDGNTLATVTSDMSGNWSWTPSVALGVGSHTIVATATDAAGNVSSSNTTTPHDYWKQFTVTTTPTVTTPATTVTTVQNAVTANALATTDGDTAVLGAEDTTAGATATGAASVASADEDSNQTSVAGASDTKTSNNVWSLLGLAWYWWLLIVAALAAFWWFIAAWRRRRNEDN